MTAAGAAGTRPRWPRPPLVASTLPPCNSATARTSASPRPRPPPARSIVVCFCVNGSKRSRAISGAKPTPSSATATSAFPQGSTDSDSRRRAAGQRELGGVVQQVADGLSQPRRVAVDRHRLVRRAPARASRPWRRTGCGGPRRCSAAARRGRRLHVQLDLAAHDARHVEQLVHEVPRAGRPAGGSRRARAAPGGCRAACGRARTGCCGSAPAGCAARARAWPGTRSSGGRCRAGRPRSASAPSRPGSRRRCRRACRPCRTPAGRARRRGAARRCVARCGAPC